MAAQKTKQKQEQTLMTKTDILGATLLGEFQENEKLRLDKETIWIEDLRQAKRIYDPDIESKIQLKASKLYIGYMAGKEKKLTAKLNNMVNNGKNWKLRTTPIPNLKQEQIDIITESLVTKDEQTGQFILPTPDMVKQGIIEFANKQKDGMENAIYDQLIESKYEDVAKNVLRSGIRYGTGIFKGPMVKSKSITSLELDRINNRYIQKSNNIFIPIIEDIMLWYWYPDMSTTEVGTCDFVYEMHPMTKYEVKELTRNKEFKSDIIHEYLKENPNGDYKMKQWEIDLQNIGDKIIDKSAKITKKYQVLERYGYMDIDKLKNADIEVEGGNEIFMNIWLLGDKIIKATKSNYKSLEDLYHVFYYIKDESSIFGEGIHREGRDTQQVICATARAIMDDMGRTVHNHLIFNMDLLEEGEDPDDTAGAKSWRRRGAGQVASYKAIELLSFPSHSKDIINAAIFFKQFGDEISTIPFITEGDEKTTNETAKGVSIRHSSMNITTMDIAKNFFKANINLIKSLYQWNMEYNKDETIKGDYAIEPIPVSLMAKEEQIFAINDFMQKLPPEDQVYIKRRKSLEDRLKLLDIDPIEWLKSEEEVAADIKSRIDEEAINLAKTKEAADIAYTESKAAHMEAKAKKTMSDKDVDAIDTQVKAIGILKKGKGE